MRWLSSFAYLALSLFLTQCEVGERDVPRGTQDAPREAVPTTVGIDYPVNTDFFPSSWVSPPIEGKVEPVLESDKERIEAILDRAVAKYPEGMLSKYLERVCVVGSLEMYGVNYGGVYIASTRTITLTYRAKMDAEGFEQRFHHELSSLLLASHEVYFEKERWVTSNPQGFHYKAGNQTMDISEEMSEATKAIAEAQQSTGGDGSSLLRVSEALMKEGFMTPYNRVSVEQDFNETAAHLLANPRIWEYGLHYPRLDQKLDVMIDFYRQVDSRMDRFYFRQINSNHTDRAPSPTHE